MKKIIKNSDFKNNEIIANSTAIKGGGNGGIVVIIVERKVNVITDNINGRTQGGVITDNINGRTRIVEDNVMV